MPKLKLSYYDFHGGRGEVARIALSSANIPFEDDRIPFKEWKSRKAETPYGSIPVLAIDGLEVAQCNGINRYCGKLAGLYPEDAVQAAVCDEVMDAIEDVAVKFVRTMFIEDKDEQARAREAFAAGIMTSHAKALAARLDKSGGSWFAGGDLTVADLKVFLWVRHMRSGNVDHVPTDTLDKVAPTLVAHFERVNAHPKVRAYYDSRGL